VSLTIRRFSLRVERRGGTGWGSALEPIIAAARRGLPSHIAKALEDKLGTDEGVEISEPLRLHVRMSVAELAEVCRSESGMQRLAARLVADLMTVPQLAGTEARGAAPPMSPSATVASSGSRDTDRSSARTAERDVFAVSLEWQRRGALDEMLARLPEPALRSWLIALLRDSPISPSRAEPAEAGELRAAIKALIEQCAGGGATSNVPAGAKARASASVPMSHEQPGAQGRGREIAPLAARASAARAPTPRTAWSRAGGAAHESATTTLDGLALPFLLLRPLSASGYLDVAAASFSALDRSDELIRFAAALAFQVLDAPKRGWSHDAKTVATVAGFSGCVTPPTNGLDGNEALCGPLDAMVAQLQLQGRNDRQPLLLHLDAQGALLVDRAGLLPIAWQATLDDLIALAAPIRAHVIVPAANVGPRTLDTLAAAGVRFVTDAPPARHEHWRRIAGVRAWTNDRDSTDRELASLGDSFAVDEDVAELVATLVARQLRGVGSSVARSLGVAAAVALGDLADRLWHDREPTSPQLALSRFADLSARISLAPDRVEIAIPRGARFLDLERAGFLGTFTPPWLDGRPLTIGPA
jgi:hypothetical protein